MRSSWKHKRSYQAWKREKKVETFNEGGKNITFLSYDGLYGQTDKVLAFVQQFDAVFGGEPFTERSKLPHEVRMSNSRDACVVARQTKKDSWRTLTHNCV